MRQMTKNLNDPSRLQNIVTVTTIMLSIGWSMVLLRLYIKSFMTRLRWSWDDYTIILALLVESAQCIINMVQPKFGFGYHLKDLLPDVKIQMSFYCFRWAEVTYFVAVSLVKLSILFFLLQLSKQLQPWIYFGIAFVSGTLISSALASLLQCTPVNHAWNLSVPGHCINRTALYYSNAALNIVMDLYIYFLPIPTLWKVQLPKKQRIGLVLVFAVGGFVVITGLLRLHSLKVAAVSPDPTWDNTPASLWSEVEVCIGIFCACLPCVKPLVAKILPSFATTSSERSKEQNHLSYVAGPSNSAALEVYYNTSVVDRDDNTYPLKDQWPKPSNRTAAKPAYEARVVGQGSIGGNDHDTSDDTWSRNTNDSKEHITARVCETASPAVTLATGIFKTTNISITNSQH